MSPTVLLAIATTFANLVSTVLNAYTVMVEVRDKSLKPQYDRLLLQLAREQKGRERDRQEWEKQKNQFRADIQHIQNEHRNDLEGMDKRVQSLTEERQSFIAMIDNLSVDNDRLRDDLSRLQENKK